MSIAIDLLKAQHVGIRHLKEHLTTKLLNEPLVITDRGTPISVNLPYSDMIELIDLFDEITDIETVAAIQEARKSIKQGVKGIPVSKLFNRIRKARK